MLRIYHLKPMLFFKFLLDLNSFLSICTFEWSSFTSFRISVIRFLFSSLYDAFQVEACSSCDSSLVIVLPLLDTYGILIIAAGLF